jgi:hypothetical protein
MLHTFERRRITDHRLYGLVVSESTSLILIQELVDFLFDGYTVIRRRDVSKSYSSESNAYDERIMRKEGLWKNPPKAIRLLPLDDWHRLLASLGNKTVIIENERKDDFCIGPIVACEEHSVLIHYFDGCGKWKKIERVPYREITCVHFGDRYSTTHSRYLPPRPSNQ